MNMQIGVMEYWSDGVVACSIITPLLHRSITPLPCDNADTLSLTLAHTLLTDPNGWPGSCFA